MCGENSPKENGKWYSSIVVWKIFRRVSGEFSFSIKKRKRWKKWFWGIAKSFLLLYCSQFCLFNVKVKLSCKISNFQTRFDLIFKTLFTANREPPPFESKLINDVAKWYPTQECQDNTGRMVKHSMHFVPQGIDNCKMCVCDNGKAKVCTNFCS